MNGGVSVTKLRRAANEGSTENFRFLLKFFSANSQGKTTRLSTGSGVPIFLRVKSIHETGAGCHVTGIITKFRSNEVMHCGGILNRYLDQLPLDWFQPGYEIQLVHRGAASEGIVIALVDPDTQDKLRLITKNHPASNIAPS